MNARKIALSAAGLATVAAAVTGGVGASMAYADASTGSAGTSSSSSSSANPTDSSNSSSSSDSSNSSGSSKSDSSTAPKFGKHNHTEVTGDEATKVTDAVKAKDSNFTAEKVMKDEDGSYDVIGKSGDTFVKYDVSTDLQTITKDDHGPGKGGPGGGPGFNHEEVTGDEATKVSNAVKAKDSSFTVDKVFKHDDGSYMVAGTSGSDRVMYKVSSDLGTVEKLERPARGDRPGGPGGRDGSSQSDSNSGKSSDSSSSDSSSGSDNSSSSSDNNADSSFFSGASTSTGA